MRAVTVVLALVATLAPVGAARADVAPPDDYVDPCASMKFEESCRRCTAPEFKAHDCHEGARAAGLVERCRGWNYTMYCGGQDSSAQPLPEPRKAPEPAPEVRSPPPAPAASQEPAPPPLAPAAGQQPAPPPAPPPAVAAGGGCTIRGGGDALGLAFVLVAAVFRRRRAA